MLEENQNQIINSNIEDKPIPTPTAVVESKLVTRFNLVLTFRIYFRCKFNAQRGQREIRYGYSSKKKLDVRQKSIFFC